MALNRYGTSRLISYLSLSLLTAAVVSLPGCGKYGPPLPPEAYAPAAVKEVSVTAGVMGVQFEWHTPDDDRRGETLKNLSFFDIRRASTEDLSEFLKDPMEKSLLVGRVYDLSQELLNEQRKIAREQKTSERKVKIADELRAHIFVDEKVSPGKTYLYSIVPMTVEGVPGEVLQYVRVSFSGLTSRVEYLDSSAFDKPYVLDF